MLRGFAFGIVGAMVSAHAAALPACAPPVEVSGVRVVRVEKNGVLVLEDGRAVKVEGLLLPEGTDDHAPRYFADEAIGAMSDLTRGRVVTLAAGTPKEDRYGRLRAQVFIDDNRDTPTLWLQLVMLHRGLGRVSIAPDRRECASMLYAAEDEARRNRQGIWSQAWYAVRPASRALIEDTDTFQLVRGMIVSAEVKNDRAYLDFGTDWRRDFTVVISPQDMKAFRQAGIDPQSYEGRTVRVRGWVENLHRPEIEVAIPEDIEVLDPP
ncbi:MAG TPA: thermonuclease family protein [Rhizomicrobium sp.]